MRFTGNYEELKEKLSKVFKKEKWNTLNDNQMQCKHDNGTVINWYPTTGTILLQGRSPGKEELEKIVRDIIENNVATPENVLEMISKENISSDKKVDEYTEIDEYLSSQYTDSELIIGLVGAAGTELGRVTEAIKNRLMVYKYNTEVIKVSTDVIRKIFSPEKEKYESEYERIEEHINLGNLARQRSNDYSILALGVASEIMRRRTRDEKNEVMPKKRTAFIIDSLKHPKEVERLREIYSSGFFLIGVYTDEKRRFDYLVDIKGMKPEEANKIIKRDADESVKYGQHTRDAFQISDFFIQIENNPDKERKSIDRILDLIFGYPFSTPEFDEFAMFMAFTSALRSADLSRQVGAVIARDKEIIASGVNDCPKAGGGLYWPEFNPETKQIEDCENGRDYKRKFDSNKIEQSAIIDNIINSLGLEKSEDIIKKLKNSRIKDLTEYGRIVHAEMEALLMCARNNISTKGATLYCTTFPCHNCAKHIIAAGIKKVVYVEPYPKSKAFEFYADSISSEEKPDSNLVLFVPFVGVGPRKFFELFSMSIGSDYGKIRKDDDGYILEWEPTHGRLRTQLLPYSYLERETYVTSKFLEVKEKIKC